MHPSWFPVAGFQSHLFQPVFPLSKGFTLLGTLSYPIQKPAIQKPALWVYFLQFPFGGISTCSRGGYSPPLRQLRHETWHCPLGKGKTSNLETISFLGSVLVFGCVLSTWRLYLSPYHPCMVYLHAFGVFLMVNVRKYKYTIHGWNGYICHYKNLNQSDWLSRRGTSKEYPWRWDSSEGICEVLFFWRC